MLHILDIIVVTLLPGATARQAAKPSQTSHSATKPAKAALGIFREKPRPESKLLHQALNAAVDKLYRKEPFNSDRERVEFLLARYERERAPLVAEAQPTKKRRGPQ